MKIKDLKGIGPKKENCLKELGVLTSRDLRYHFPRRYEDRRRAKEIIHLVDGEVAYIKGEIKDIKKSKISRNNWILRLKITDGSGFCEVVFFHAYYLSRAFFLGREVFFYGKVSRERLIPTMTHPEFFLKAENAIVPIYPLTKGISQNDILKWQKTVIAVEKEKEYLPKDLLEKNQLMDLEQALEEIHFPQGEARLKKAKNRIIYDELFLFQLGVLLSKTTREDGIPFEEKGEKRFLELLDYPLTKAQERVIEEISKDMEAQRPMNRLIQGDVGSGKTVVAEVCLYKAVLNGYQGCMMAPTEILARQHYETLMEHFKRLGLKVGFLSGQMNAKEKRQVLKALEAGEINILVGTHAVIQKDVVFQKLGLVITDEQHRFGVSQREELMKKGRQPDILVMTATPIPRTLAVVLYGDLDVSVIDELPPGRTPIKTTAVTGKARNQVYDFLEGEIQKGHQSYVVSPFIEEGEMSQIRSAEEIHKELSLRFGEEKVALLHGKMKQKEKEDIMMAFVENKISILVATVVIEVGINVPNATVMIIENAERFGLAQLHQLRGRVGRGGKESYCLLVVEGKSEMAMERVKTLKESTDGFYISEKDLSLRGPGEFFGLKQHGIPTLKMADLIKHMGRMEGIRRDAMELLERYPNLDHEEVKDVKHHVKQLVGEGERMNL